jgi:6-phosphogluconolactonase (cycloisomerase 2 family)
LNPAPENSKVAITGSFSFTDPGGHLNGGSFNFTYGGSTTTIALGAGFAGVTSGSGQIMGPAQLITGAGAVTVPCWLVDSAGNRSNTVNVSFIQAVARFGYLVNDDGTIYVYGIDASTGRLRHNGYYLAGSSHNRSIAVDPSQRFVYAPNGNDNDIWAFTVNETTGALTAVSGSPFPAGTVPYFVAVDPSGRFVYVTNYTSGDISQYTITQSGPAAGALTAIAASVPVGGASPAEPRAIAVDPTGRFAYTANYGNSTVSAFAINQTTGALTAIGSPVPSGTTPYYLVVDPTGSFVYVADNTGIKIYIYAIDPTTGALTATGASPVTIAAGAGPTAMAVDPLDGFLYVGDASNTVYSYAITPATGALTQSSTVGTGAAPRGITVDPESGIIYVSENNDTVSTFSQAGGVLTALTAPYRISTGYGPNGANAGPYQMAMMFGSSRATYVPKYAYVADNNSSSASQYTINPATGVLSAQSPATAVAGTNPLAVVADPFGRFAYVANYTSGNVSEYTIAAGALTAVAGSPLLVGTNPQAVAVDPSGQFAYVADYTTGNVYEYTITQTGGSAGALTPILLNTSIAAGTNPYSIAVDPAGRFVYVANYAGGAATSSTISEYAITQTTGALGLIGTVPTGTLTAAQVVAVEPMGRWAYVAVNGGTVYAYAIDLTAGGLVTPAIGSIAGGANPQAIAFDPLGRFAYVACNGGSVYVYSIGATGALAAGVPQASIAVAGAWGVSVDPSGQYAYVTKSTNANSVSVFSINQATGALTDLLSPATTGSTPEGIAVTGTIQ